MKCLPRIALVTLFSGFLLSSCGDDDSTSPEGGDVPFNGTVRVVDNRFIPSSVTITAGDSVTWRFDGNNRHTVTEGANLGNPSPLFDSGLMSSGTFGYRFNAAGTFPYHCQPHFNQNMRGTVTVRSP